MKPDGGRPSSSGVLDWSVGLVSAKIYPEISWDAGVLFP